MGMTGLTKIALLFGHKRVSSRRPSHDSTRIPHIMDLALSCVTTLLLSQDAL